MGSERSDLGLYYEGLARSGAPLPSVLQHRIVRHADTEKRPELLVALLGRKDLDAALVDRLAKHSSAPVRVAWLQRHADDPQVFRTYVAGETRKTVLAALAAQPELPDDAFAMIVERADGADLVLTVLETYRLDNVDAEKLIARAADSVKLTQLPTQTRIKKLLETYPGLWHCVAMTTGNRAIATEAVHECGAISEELLERVLTRFIETPLDSVDPLHTDDLMGFWDLIRTLGYCEELPPGAHERIASAAAAVLDRFGPPRPNGDWYGANHALRELATIARGNRSELPETVELLKQRTPASATKALEDLSRYLASSKYDRYMRSPTAEGILATIIGDDAYGPEARRRAVQVAVENTSVTGTRVVKVAELTGCTIDEHMVLTVWRHSPSPALRADILKVAADPTSALRHVINEERFDLAARLSQMEEIGVLDDDLFELAVPRITAKMLFSRPWADKSLKRRAISAITRRVVAELGDADTTWEFFEACFDNVDTGVVELAEMSATAT